MFEKANRMKLRFTTPKGVLSVEDLWDLPLTSSTGKANLDDIAKALHRKLKDEADTSFVEPSATGDKTLQLQFDIVKHIIDIRIDERNAAAIARANKDKKQMILELIAKKKNEELANASLDELEKLAESL